jgi:hypothetical protein
VNCSCDLDQQVLSRDFVSYVLGDDGKADRAAARLGSSCISVYDVARLGSDLLIESRHLLWLFFWMPIPITMVLIKPKKESRTPESFFVYPWCDIFRKLFSGVTHCCVFIGGITIDITNAVRQEFAR